MDIDNRYFSIELFSNKIYLVNSVYDYKNLYEYITGIKIDEEIRETGIIRNYIELDGSMIIMIGIFENDRMVIEHVSEHVALSTCEYMGHRMTKDDELVSYIIKELTDKIIKRFKEIKYNKRNQKEEHDRRSICFRVMVTKEERAKIAELSEKSEYKNESEYARSRILCDHR